MQQSGKTRFSIIVPVYNTAQYLADCIGSVIEQTFEDWELILVDDGSTDDSGSMLDEYAANDSRIRVVHQDNLGQFFARRAGITTAQGEYILFLDSDDALVNICIEKVYSEIATTGADILLFAGKVSAYDNKPERVIAHFFNEKSDIDSEWIKEKLLSCNELNSLCMKAFKRELFLGDTSDYTAFFGHCCAEDKAQLFYPVTKATHYRCIPDALYLYRYRFDSAMHSFSLHNVKRMMAEEMFALLYDYMVKWGMGTKEHIESYWVYYLKNFLTVYYNVRKRCIENGNYREFRSFKWNEIPDKRSLLYENSNLLSKREKFKLVATLFKL